MQVNIKLQEGALLPKRVNEYASGYDCYAHLIPDVVDDTIIRPGENRLISLGFSIEIPVGYEARVRSRSGLGKDGICVLHGTIDCDYRGVVMANIFNHSFKHFSVRDGMRICQIVIQKVESVEFVAVDELSETERADKGFGSSGV